MVSAVITYAIPPTDPGYVDVDAGLSGGDAAPDVYVIAPLTPLPELTRGEIVINGQSQHNQRGDTNPFGPEIVLDGSLLGEGTNGLHLTSDNNHIHGLNIQNFSSEIVGSIQQAGIFIDGDGNRVTGNFIGTNAVGTAAAENRSGVVLRNSSNNTVGGSSPEARNVISGNTYMGIQLQGASHDNTIQGNFIGTDASGLAAVGQGKMGIDILVDSSRNLIGTDGDGVNDQHEGNVIANNLAEGVVVTGTTSVGNTIRGNSIHDNGGLGIDLGGDGVTANVLLDADAGPNGLQNFPQISSVKARAETKVTGKLKSTPNNTFTIDFYASAAVDPSGYGEGMRWLGFAVVTSNEEGTAPFNVTLAAETLSGEVVTATATDSSGNTSEFSAPSKKTAGGGNGKPIATSGANDAVSPAPLVELSNSDPLVDDSGVGAREPLLFSHHRRDDALAAIITDWNNGHWGEDRVRELRGDDAGGPFTGRANSNTLLTADGDSSSVVDDTDRDHLSGSVGRDLYFTNLAEDQLVGR